MNAFNTCPICGWGTGLYRACEGCAHIRKELAEKFAEYEPKPGDLGYRSENPRQRREHIRIRRRLLCDGAFG